jgi:hypothetical protein
VGVIGSADTTSTRSGTFWIASPARSRYSLICSTVSGSAAR